MSLYLFLDREVFDAVSRASPDRIIPNGSAKYEGMEIRFDADLRPHYWVRNEMGPKSTLIPLPLVGHVVSVSWHTFLPASCRTKVSGIYEYESAEAVVERDGESRPMARIHGPDLEHANRLYRQLHAGTAELREAWEDVQDQDSLQPIATADEMTRIDCLHCHQAYRIKTVKIVGKMMFKIACKKCGEDILVRDGKVVMPTTADAAPRDSGERKPAVKKDPDGSGKPN